MTDLWRGQWGDAYHARNPCTDAEIAKRILLWRKVLSCMSLEDAPKTFLEVGAGLGANVRAIDEIYTHNGIDAQIHALEPGPFARGPLWDSMRLRERFGGLVDGTADNIDMPDASVDMVYTYGVLIHVLEDDLTQSMSEIYRCSKRWIFCAEYYNPETVMVPYHGKSDALWKRPYGDLWLDKFDLALVAYGYEWKRVSGLDNVTWWLMRKTSDKA